MVARLPNEVVIVATVILSAAGRLPLVLAPVIIIGALIVTFRKGRNAA